MAFFIAIGASVLVICSVLVARGVFSRQRRKRFKGLELRPNCLLTRYPILFLARPKSLFRLMDEWRDVPLFLREHGYEVLILTPNRRVEYDSVLSTLQDFHTKCHLIADGSQRELLEKLADARLDQIASLTIVQSGRHSTTKSRLRIDDLRPSRLAIEIFDVQQPKRRTEQVWQTERCFLDYAISLAERDAGWCDL